MLMPTFTNRYKWYGTQTQAGHTGGHTNAHIQRIEISKIADDKYEQRFYCNRLSFSIQVFFFYIFLTILMGKWKFLMWISLIYISECGKMNKKKM